MNARAARKINPSAKAARHRDVVVLPRATYESLIERIEDLEDARFLRRAESDAVAGRRNYLPWEAAKRMTSGEHPVRVWREHLGLTLTELSAKSKIPAGYLSEIENGKKPGSTRAMKALAAALGIAVDDILP